MIRPPHFEGAVFSEAQDGDVRNDLHARASLSETLGVSDEWALVRQVHGTNVVEVHDPGDHGQADALWTRGTGVPVAVFTADCFGVILRSPEAIGVAHAGWRGIRSGVVAALSSEMANAGHAPTQAALGPGIRRCCFEVGPEVATQFDGYGTSTSWGSQSVDLETAILAQLEGIDVWMAKRCTHHESGLFSHRRTGEMDRLAALGWLE